LRGDDDQKVFALNLVEIQHRLLRGDPEILLGHIFVLPVILPKFSVAIEDKGTVIDQSG
jgi:hypothetical protein